MEGAPGDLIITIREAPHPVFARHGDSLHTWVVVSLE